MVGACSLRLCGNIGWKEIAGSVHEGKKLFEERWLLYADAQTARELESHNTAPGQLCISWSRLV